MKKLLLAIAVSSLAFAPPALAANVNIDGLPAAASVAGANLYECEQGGINNKCTATQIAAFIYGLMSGDATASGTGAVTFATVNANVGSFGSATQCAAVTVNAKGLITAISAATCAPAVGSITGFGAGIGTWLATPSSANLLAALTTKTGTGNAVFGTAPTIDSLNATTALTLAFITGSTQCLHVNTSGVLSGTGSDCGAAGVTSAIAGIGITVSAATGAVTFSAPVTTRNNTATTDTITSTDKGTVVTESNASAVAVAITTAGFVSTDYFTVKNLGVGLATYTPSSGTIDGAATLACKQNQSADLYFDGTNYKTLANSCGLGTASVATTGTSGHALPFLDGANTFSGTQTFGSVFGTVSTQSGTTYTLASTDCGTEVAFTNAAAVTVTIPAALTTGCNIAILQTTAAGQVTVTGTAVSAATLHSGHSYTKTFGQWSIIGINIYTTGVAILTGDGA